jgi:hypothetical protein
MPRIESSDVIRGLLWSGPPVPGRELDLLSISLPVGCRSASYSRQALIAARGENKISMQDVCNRKNLGRQLRREPKSRRRRFRSTHGAGQRLLMAQIVLERRDGLNPWWIGNLSGSVLPKAAGLCSGQGRPKLEFSSDDEQKIGEQVSNRDGRPPCAVKYDRPARMFLKADRGPPCFAA